MRILIILPTSPFPPDNGGKLRAASLALYLARHHEVVLACFHESKRSSAFDKELNSRFLEIREVGLPRSPAGLRRWISSEPGSTQDLNSHEMVNCIDDLVTRYSPDLLLVGAPGLTPYVLPYPDRPRVLDYLCADVLQCARLGRLSSAWGRVLWHARKLKHAAYLKRIAKCYDMCIVNSEEDRLSLLSTSSNWQRIEFIPNGLNLTDYPLGLASPEPNTMIFHGALTYLPNLDGADYFIHGILPRIRSRLPNARVLITGQVPTNHPVPQGPGVIYTGYVQDVRPVIAGAWVCTVPLRAGAGGSRFKVLEALALGTPIVSTRVGLEGMNVEHNVNALVAQNPEEFAARTIDVLQSPGFRERLSTAGRRLIETQYNWEVLGNRFSELLADVVKEKRNGSRKNIAQRNPKILGLCGKDRRTR